ncbi:hypothetical protein [Sphingomonas sp. BAUL-RG-20F-R05-02]|uniref:hypothetical protein n=1 Tax=Sphingomonas sp. BAUL-RG-20F-R05-02 TaxID=2914830 RepID=UPI001F567C00|nr:hypothetical protein [Sphingomonas sp. BAUL-RG-20F-R05-02]
MTLTDVIRLGGLASWVFCLACLTSAVVRIAQRRPRYLDPIWGLVFLLAINRISFALRISPDWSRATAMILAIAMGLISLSYQRSDAGVAR